MSKYIAFSCHMSGEDCVGSESYFECDGRWNLTTSIEKARNYYKSLIHVPYGFRICVGTILNHTKVTNIIKL